MKPPPRSYIRPPPRALRPPSLPYRWCWWCSPLPTLLVQIVRRPSSSARACGRCFWWRGGIAPPSVRKVLRREIRRRGLGQGQTAERIGVLCPQLANIMQGRFGASSGVAESIRSFLSRRRSPADTSPEPAGAG
jgi:hypothetical protein